MVRWARVVLCRSTPVPMCILHGHSFYSCQEDVHEHDLSSAARSSKFGVNFQGVEWKGEVIDGEGERENSFSGNIIQVRGLVGGWDLEQGGILQWRRWHQAEITSIVDVAV